MFTETYCGRNKADDWTTTDVSGKIVELSAASKLSFCDSNLPIKARALSFDRETQSHEIVSTIPVFTLKHIHSGLFSYSCFRFPQFSMNRLLLLIYKIYCSLSMIK